MRTNWGTPASPSRARTRNPSPAAYRRGFAATSARGAGWAHGPCRATSGEQSKAVVGVMVGPRSRGTPGHLVNTVAAGAENNLLRPRVPVRGGGGACRGQDGGKVG